MMAERKCINCMHYKESSPEDTTRGVGNCLYDRSIPIPGSVPLSWANRVVRHESRCHDFEPPPAAPRRPKGN